MTYIEELKAAIKDIRVRTKAGVLPIGQRMDEIDVITTKYAIEHALAYGTALEKERVSAENDGRKVRLPPINYKDAYLLQELADLALYEDLTWSHPDKMSVIEYPILTDSQREERLGDEVSYKWAEEVGSDRRDYRLPTRENLRKLR